MRCSYVASDELFDGFRCNKLATIDGMCDSCHEITRMDEIKNKNRMLCLFTLSAGKYANYTCQKYANIDFGLCSRCHSHINCIGLTMKMRDYHPILNIFCEPQHHENLKMYLNKMSLTSKQLSSAFEVALNISSNDLNVITILLSKNFFPDSYGYSFLTGIKFPKPSQFALSSFFYKRFLIKSCIETQELIDCLPRILDPYMIPIDKPRYYTKFMLHRLLFPLLPYNDDRIDFDISCVVKATGILDVAEYSHGLYCELSHNFILHQSSSGQIIAIGLLSDNNQIVPLSIQEQAIARSIGLYTDQSVRILNSDIPFNNSKIKVTRCNDYLYQDKYLLCDHNNPIGKIIDDKIYDLDNSDIAMLKSL